MSRHYVRSFLRKRNWSLKRDRAIDTSMRCLIDSCLSCRENEGGELKANEERSLGSSFMSPRGISLTDPMFDFLSDSWQRVTHSCAWRNHVNLGQLSINGSYVLVRVFAT